MIELDTRIRVIEEKLVKALVLGSWKNPIKNIGDILWDYIITSKPV